MAYQKLMALPFLATSIPNVILCPPGYGYISTASLTGAVTLALTLKLFDA